MGRTRKERTGWNRARTRKEGRKVGRFVVVGGIRKGRSVGRVVRRKGRIVGKVVRRRGRVVEVAERRKVGRSRSWEGCWGSRTFDRIV